MVCSAELSGGMGSATPARPNALRHRCGSGYREVLDLDGSVELAARTPAVNAAHSLGLKVSAESVGSQILTARPSREAGRATPLG
jgi:hypothetical protein